MWTKVVREHFVLQNDDSAFCTQEITFNNGATSPVDLSDTFEISFHKNCTNFSFSSNDGRLDPQLQRLIEEPYQKRVQYSLRGSLAPGEEAVLRLTYAWKEFRRLDQFENIATKFDTLTTYNIEIETGDDSFIGYLISVYDGEKVLRRGPDYNVTDAGHLVISRPNLSPNFRMNLRIVAKIKKIELNVVKDISEEYNDCFGHKYIILTILHLLRDSLSFFAGLKSMGASSSEVYVVGIPYSSKPEVIEHLRSEFYTVYSEEKSNYLTEFYSLVKEALKKVVLKCNEEGKKLVIIEDGGYAVPIFLTDPEFEENRGLLVGAVEQTKNGIWADGEVEKEGKLIVPVINVAESRIKKERESPLIGRAILLNLTRLLENSGRSLTNLNIGQIGYGDIGEKLAERIRAEGATLTIYDFKDDRRLLARSAGFNVVDELSLLFHEKNLIIGCSGQEVVGLEELKRLDKSIYFVNASSKLKELKYKQFIEATTKLFRRRGIGIDYVLKGRRRIVIHLLADGFPINFYELSESVPDMDIQFIYALLLSASGFLITGSHASNGIVTIPDEIQTRIEELMALYKEEDV